MDAWPLLGSLAVTGLLGSLGHCSGMCGPLVLMLGLRARASGSRHPAGAQLVYHAARIAVYGVLGAAAALLGGALGAAAGLGHAEAWLSLVLGAVVAAFGLAYLGAARPGRTPLPLPWLDRGLEAALRRGGWPATAGMGALNGLLPCGLVYAALVLVASSSGAAGAARGAAGDAALGAGGMLAFGAATIPVLLVIGLGGAALAPRVRARLQRVAGVLVVVVGLQLVLRGAAQLGAVPHLTIGSLVLW